MKSLRRPEQWLTVIEVADLLHMHVESVRRELRSGRMKGHKVGGKWWRVSETDLAGWQESQRWAT